MLSPFLLRCGWFLNIVDWFLEPLQHGEYKEAFIGALGGMIGSFLAISGALWVERRLVTDKEKKEIERIALILYYDIFLFYEEFTALSSRTAQILAIDDKDAQRETYITYKNSIGVHIHSDWIGLVASLKGILEEDEIKKIYTFYGHVSDIKLLIEKDHVETGSIERVSNAFSMIGITVDGKYQPNQDYTEILRHLKEMAKI